MTVNISVTPQTVCIYELSPVILPIRNLQSTLYTQHAFTTDSAHQVVHFVGETP